MPDIFPVFPKARFDQMMATAKSFDPAITKVPATDKWYFDHAHGGRLDASESSFIARQLEALRAGVIEVQYPALKGATMVPIDTSIDPGAASYTYQTSNIVGQALVTASLSGHGPRADVSGTESNQVLRSIVASYGYSLQEARSAMFARVPLVPRRAMAARDVIERKIDDIWFLGDVPSGLSGFLNLAGANSYTVANSAAKGLTSWDDKTPDEICADLNGVVNKIVSDTLDVYSPDTLVLPLSRYTLIASRRMGDADPNTILSHFLRNSPYITSVMATHKSESNSAWTGKRGVCYRRDPNVLTGLLSQPFEQFAPQAEGMEVITDCHARSGGVILLQPKAVAYFDGI